MLLNRLNRLHYGFEKFIYFCFQQKKIACIIEIIEKKLCHFFLSCTLCHFFLCHFFLVPFFPVPFFPVPFFPVPFFPTLHQTKGKQHKVRDTALGKQVCQKIREQKMNVPAAEAEPSVNVAQPDVHHQTKGKQHNMRDDARREHLCVRKFRNRK